MIIIRNLIILSTFCCVTTQTVNQAGLMTHIEAGDIIVQKGVGLPALPYSPSFVRTLQILHTSACKPTHKKVQKLQAQLQDSENELASLKMLQAATKNDLEQEKTAHKQTKKDLDECIKNK